MATVIKFCPLCGVEYDVEKIVKRCPYCKSLFKESEQEILLKSIKEI